MTSTIQERMMNRLGSRYICTTNTIEEANEVIRELLYDDLGDWIEVNKAIRDRTAKYDKLIGYVGEDDEDFDYYVHEVDYVIVYRKK